MRLELNVGIHACQDQPWVRRECEHANFQLLKGLKEVPFTKRITQLVV